MITDSFIDKESILIKSGDGGDGIEVVKGVGREPFGGFLAGDYRQTGKQDTQGE